MASQDVNIKVKLDTREAKQQMGSFVRGTTDAAGRVGGGIANIFKSLGLGVAGAAATGVGAAAAVAGVAVAPTAALGTQFATNLIQDAAIRFGPLANLERGLSVEQAGRQAGLDFANRVGFAVTPENIDEFRKIQDQLVGLEEKRARGASLLGQRFRQEKGQDNLDKVLFGLDALIVQIRNIIPFLSGPRGNGPVGANVNK